jgi:hypothetical protein
MRLFSNIGRGGQTMRSREKSLGHIFELACYPFTVFLQ